MTEIERLDLAPGGVVHDVAQIGEILLQNVERADPVQRLHRVIGIAQPAVTVVPVALRPRSLGHRSGQRGDDRAGLLVLAELQRDGTADDLVLPFERDRQAANPQAPVSPRAFLHPPQFGAQVPADRLVRAEEEMLVALDPPAALFQQVPDGRIGAEPHRLLAQAIADVVGAAGRACRLCAVAMPGGQAACGCAGCRRPGGRCARRRPGDTCAPTPRSAGRNR